jgi:small conductance mechanosensitive channel
MAGLMLRAVRAFRPGDHVRVGGHFGRISELGLFHVEIQTEDRDLTTMPNIYLVNNPFKVIRSSGTFVSTQVSLGYDVHHARVKQALILAAEDTGLQECFVHILELGDFSVTYKVSGLLTDTKKILTVSSRLKRRVLDQLHEVGIEIVSPNFMNQRILAEARRMIPDVGPTLKLDPDEAAPEARVFDKAEAAESLEELRVKYTLLRTQLEEKKVRLRTVESDSEKSALTQQIESDEKRLSRLAEFLKSSET